MLYLPTLNTLQKKRKAMTKILLPTTARLNTPVRIIRLGFPEIQLSIQCFISPEYVNVFIWYKYSAGSDWSY